MQTHVHDSHELDLIWSAEAIAAVIGRTTHETYLLLARGHLPAKRVGKKWVASRRQLAEHFGVPVAA